MHYLSFSAASTTGLTSLFFAPTLSLSTLGSESESRHSSHIFRSACCHMADAEMLYNSLCVTQQYSRNIYSKSWAQLHRLLLVSSLFLLAVDAIQGLIFLHVLLSKRISSNLSFCFLIRRRIFDEIWYVTY